MLRDTNIFQDLLMCKPPNVIELLLNQIHDQWGISYAFFMLPNMVYLRVLSQQIMSYVPLKQAWVMGYQGFMGYACYPNLEGIKKYGVLGIMGYRGYGSWGIQLYYACTSNAICPNLVLQGPVQSYLLPKIFRTGTGTGDRTRPSAWELGLGTGPDLVHEDWDWDCSPQRTA